MYLCTDTVYEKKDASIYVIVSIILKQLFKAILKDYWKISTINYLLTSHSVINLWTGNYVITSVSVNLTLMTPWWCELISTVV